MWGIICYYIKQTAVVQDVININYLHRFCAAFGSRTLRLFAAFFGFLSSDV